MPATATVPTDLPERKPEPAEEETPRLPMGTRLSLYYIFVVFLVIFVLQPLVAFLLLGPEEKTRFLAGELDKGLGFSLGVGALLTPLVIAVTIGFVRFVDRKPLASIGAVWPAGQLQRAVRDLVSGFAGAAVLLGLWYVIAGFLVRFEVDRSGAETEALVAEGPMHLLLLGLGFLVSAASYEWILRGYIYSVLREKLSWVHAGGLTALLFALFQVLNPGIPAPGLASAFLLGFLLAAIRELSGSLWPGAVFHGAWNFLMGCVLSLPVSGAAVPGLQVVRVEGPETWSGGEYGPEGSWLTVALLLAAVLVAAALLGHEETDDEDEEDDEPQPFF